MADNLDNDELDKTPLLKIKKPRPPPSEKQMENFKKMAEKRAENVQKRKEEKRENQGNRRRFVKENNNLHKLI